MPGFDPTLRLPVCAGKYDPQSMWIIRAVLGAAIVALLVVALAL